MQEISYQDFEKVDIRIGKILEVENFPEARKPSYKLKIDFGPEIGIKRSSAQICDLYLKEDLIGKLVLGVVNFPKKQIGPFFSESLILGVNGKDKGVVLIQPERDVNLGEKLY